MKKPFAIALAVVGLLLGVALGVNTNRYFTRQHEKTTAVMVLLQLHLDSWKRATQGKQCPQAMTDLTALQFLSKQISVVLPLADSQDKVFHQHVVHLEQVLDAAAGQYCAVSMTELKSVHDVCDECHREYR